SGNVNSAVAAGFTVDTSGPDSSGPSANISAPDVTAPGGTDQQITVVYADGGKVAAGSIDPSDITVARTDGLPLTVTGVNVSPNKNSPTVTAVYTVAA